MTIANSCISAKFVNKLMRLAKSIGEENKECYARQIGSVISDTDGRIISTGYNAPPRKCPNTDSYEYIEEFLWPKLKEKEKELLYSKVSNKEISKDAHPDKTVASLLEGCKTCPRRLLGYASGERLDICSCVHSEDNAITLSKSSVEGGILFCYCPLPCFTCTKTIVQAKIREVHAVDGVYDESSKFLFKYANIPFFIHNSKEFI